MRRLAGGSVWLLLLLLLACCPVASASEGEESSADVVYLLDVSRAMDRAGALERGCAVIRSHLEHMVVPGTRVVLLPFRAKPVEGARYLFGADLEANGETRRALASRLDALEATGRSGDLSVALARGLACLARGARDAEQRHGDACESQPRRITQFEIPFRAQNHVRRDQARERSGKRHGADHCGPDRDPCVASRIRIVAHGSQMESEP